MKMSIEFKIWNHSDGNLDIETTNGSKLLVILTKNLMKYSLRAKRLVKILILRIKFFDLEILIILVI